MIMMMMMIMITIIIVVVIIIIIIIITIVIIKVNDLIIISIFFSNTFLWFRDIPSHKDLLEDFERCSNICKQNEECWMDCLSQLRSSVTSALSDNYDGDGDDDDGDADDDDKEIDDVRAKALWILWHNWLSIKCAWCVIYVLLVFVFHKGIIWNFCNSAETF